MPCHTVQRMSVDINCSDRDLLEEALKSLELIYQRTGDRFYLDGIIIGESDALVNSGKQGQLNAIKREYSKEAVKKKMKTKKWNGSWKKTKTGMRIKLKKY